MFYEHRSSEENLNNIMSDLTKLQSHLHNEIETLKNQNDIKKIEILNTLLVEGLKVSLWSDSGIYSNRSTQLRIDLSSELKELMKNNASKDFGLRTYRDYGFIALVISEEKQEEHKQSFIGFLDKLIEMDQITHDENLKRAATNKQTYESIVKLLERVGIRSSYYGYKSNRSSKKTEQYYSWRSEISGQIPTYYDEVKIDNLKKQLTDTFDRLYQQELNKVREARKAKEKEEAERLANKKLALLLAKYDLSLEAEWSDILEKLLEQNKYLRLAHYLKKNREDWNEGYHYAERGLDGFEVVTGIDQLIHDDISSYFGEGWDYDGRVFRDCKYNYSVLFTMAVEQEPQLYADYEEVSSNIED